RATARIRATVDAFVGSSRLGQAVVPPGRWERSPGPWVGHVVEAAVPVTTPLDLRLVIRSAPLVRRTQSELGNPELLVERVLLACLVAAGVAAHGSVAFFPDHSPPDLDIHVRRTLDLFGVPLDYASLLRYGSQLPTASQDQGAATAALGQRTLIPYSPLP